MRRRSGRARLVAAPGPVLPRVQRARVAVLAGTAAALPVLQAGRRPAPGRATAADERVLRRGAPAAAAPLVRRALVVAVRPQHLALDPAEGVAVARRLAQLAGYRLEEGAVLGEQLDEVKGRGLALLLRLLRLDVRAAAVRLDVLVQALAVGADFGLGQAVLGRLALVALLGDGDEGLGGGGVGAGAALLAPLGGALAGRLAQGRGRGAAHARVEDDGARAAAALLAGGAGAGAG